MSKQANINEGQPAADKPAQFPFWTGDGAGARPITSEQAAAIFTAAEIEAGEKRGDVSTSGPWGVIHGYRALAIGQDLSGVYHEYSGRPLKVYGFRQLSRPRQCGHELEGRVCVDGKSFRGFTTSALLELPGGRLVSVAAIHVCNELTSSLGPIPA